MEPLCSTSQLACLSLISQDYITSVSYAAGSAVVDHPTLLKIDMVSNLECGVSSFLIFFPASLSSSSPLLLVLQLTQMCSILLLHNLFKVSSASGGKRTSLSGCKIKRQLKQEVNLEKITIENLMKEREVTRCNKLEISFVAVSFASTEQTVTKRFIIHNKIKNHFKLLKLFL